MVDIKVKRYIVFSLGPNGSASGYLRRTIRGSFGFTKDVLRAEFFYDKEEAGEIIAYWSKRLKTVLYMKPVGVAITDDLSETYTLSEYEQKAVQGFYMERIRQIRDNTTGETYEGEQKLLVLGANLIKSLGKLYKVDSELTDNFHLVYKGFHIVGVHSATPNSSGVEIRDYSVPGNGYKDIRDYIYPKGDEEKRGRRVRMAKIYIDQIETTYRINKYL